MLCSFQKQNISIHAPREGSDTPPAVSGGKKLSISIHAPREGSDQLECHVFLRA